MAKIVSLLVEVRVRQVVHEKVLRLERSPVQEIMVFRLVMIRILVAMQR